MTMQPEALEICVKTLHPHRYAAESGHYYNVFKGFNDAVTLAAAGH